MIGYLSKLFGLSVFSIFIIYKYYEVTAHNESGSGYTGYFITIAILYTLYKVFTQSSSKKVVSFSPASIALYAFLHLFVLCFVYFGIIGAPNAGFVLFFKIIGYLILPITITIIAYGTGNKLIESTIQDFKAENSTFRFMLSLGVGFVVFLSSLTILGSLGFYNIWSVLLILAVSSLYARKEIITSINNLWKHRIEFPTHKSDGTFFEQINLPLISTEALFLILTYLVSINFINIVRPMPIGWDDLGAYMNYPQIMANNGSLIKGAGMVAWQTLTGIGFMFHSAPQAFFMNQIGGILSIIVIVLAIGSLLSQSQKTDNTKSFINLPLLGATVFYAMPMIIFQQAKDMKLDPGLFFVSVIAIYGLFYIFTKYKNSLEEKSEVATSEIPGIHFFQEHKNLAYIGIIGMIVGLAFTIKITSLMLILGILSAIFYSKLGLAGFAGFFAFFVGIFTKFNLWTQLNVVYPKENPDFLLKVTLISLFISAIFFVIAYIQYKAITFKKTFLVSLIFILGVGVPTLPWLIKNVSETGVSGLNIMALINGKGDVFSPDYTKIFTKEELKKIEDNSTSQAISQSGQSQNEDLGRYFGYDRGANNYLKLPLNLTMQSNQPGEYTDITPFFLALIPVIFLFLAFKNPFWILGLVAMLGFEYAYFFDVGSIKGLTGNINISGFNIFNYSERTGFSTIIGDFFGRKNLPEGYIYIAILSFLPLAFFSSSLDKKEKRTELFLLNLAFASFYVFLFVIAAYGIVWYGIAMYFSFIFAVLISASYLTEYKENEKEFNGNIVRFFGSLTFLVIAGTYFFASSIPHGWNNLKAAGFNEFKSGTLGQDEGIFASHPDYFAILSTLNIQSQDSLAQEINGKIQNGTLKKLIQANTENNKSLPKLEQLLREISRTDLSKLGLGNGEIIAIQKEARGLANELYQKVLYPSKEERNTAGIYRIGTFLTYFIDNNRNRFYDDSLVFNLDKYFYDENPDITVERMKKLGLKYFLVDLNAATIDKDPRHDLTKRFERLLSTFRSSKLNLIQTDSLCLRIALEEKDPSTYLTYAGVNYESYKKDGKGVETTVTRGEKQFMCYNHILELMKDNKITETNYSYLLPLAKRMKETPPKDQSEMLQIFQAYVNHGWLVLFEIK